MHRALFAVVLSACSLTAQGPAIELLVDLDTTKDLSSSSSPTAGTNDRVEAGRFATVGVWTYFRATSPTTGVELFRTKGVTGSTGLVLDAIAGPEGSDPDYLTPLGRKLFFAASGPAGRELYVTDSTTNQTVLIDVFPGASGGKPNSSDPTSLCPLGNLVLFGAKGALGTELYASDGTAQGTALVLDIHQGAANSSEPGFLFPHAGAVYFTADDGGRGIELWRSSGTAANTALVKDIAGGAAGSFQRGSNPWFATWNNVLVFAADDGRSGRELWRSDGSVAGTQLVVDAIAGPGGSDPHLMTVFGARICFAATAEDPATTPPSGLGLELCAFDGSKLTVVDVVTGSGSSRPRGLTVAGATLWFVGNDVLCSWTGTAVRSLATPKPTSLLALGSRVLFAADELYTTDASAAGFSLVLDIDPGWVTFPTPRPRSSLPDDLTLDQAGLVLFAATRETQEGRELWVTDGTTANTQLLDDVAGAAGVAPTKDGRLDGVIGYGSDLLLVDGPGNLWHTDGTPSGTRRLLVSGVLGEPVEVGGLVFAAASSASAGMELGVLDPRLGRLSILDLYPGAAGSSRPGRFAWYRGACYFMAETAQAGNELWKSDGTANGTVLVKDIRPGTASSWPSDLVRFKGRLYFSAFDPGYGRELHATDGTAVGTTRVLDLSSGKGDSSPGLLTVAGDRLFFMAYTPATGEALWVSDGASAGTSAIVVSSFGTPEIKSLHAMGSRVFFTARGNLNGPGQGIWVSDGTVAGTKVVHQVSPTAYTPPQDLTVVGDKLWFRHNQNLYVWSGGPATLIVGAAMPSRVVPAGDRQVCFNATDAVHGSELWCSDGSAAGTRVLDLRPGPAGSEAAPVAVAGTSLVVTARIDPRYGREPYVVGLDAFARAAGQSCGSSIVHPRLTATAPVLGLPWTITAVSWAGASANQAVLVTGLNSAYPLPLGRGCVAYVDLAGPLILQPLSVNSGVARLVVPLPLLAALVDVRFPLQAAFGPTSMPPLGLDLTNVVYAVPDVR